MARLLHAVFILAAVTLHSLAAEKKPVPDDHPERVRKGLALFKQHVRTDLTKHCLKCHGGQSVKGDFDLATRKSLIDSGFVETTAKASHLLRLITHAEEPHMPFKSPKLPNEVILRISQWIDLGAPYDKPLVEKTETDATQPMQVSDEDRQFWSFLPLAASQLPNVQNADWCLTPIDRFVLAKLESQKLVPNSPASRRVLVRRAYASLLGLPPTPQDVGAFVSDDDPQAWSKLIDRLLESQHYGERWARHWMDVARFAESHGYEQDYNRPHAYHYRDFLIKALNSDMPYDQFVRWQLAGDELAPDDPLAMMATGFLGAGVFPTQLTEAEFESARYDELDDMVTTTGVAFLGLSIGCARCHDHKFDPIPTRDYYRLASSFTSTIRSEIDLDLDPVGNREKKEAWETRLAELTSQSKKFRQTELPDRFRKFLKTYTPEKQLSTWETLHIVEIKSTGGTKFQLQSDASQLATGAAPNKEVITVLAETKSTAIRAIRLEALTHASLPRKGPGRAANGNFALGDFKVVAMPLEGDPVEVSAKLVAARATHQQNTTSLSVAASIDGDAISGWAVDKGGIGKDQAAVFDFEKPVGFEQGTRFTVTLTLNHPNAKHTLGRFRLSVSDQASPKAEVGNTGLDSKVVEALASLKQKPDESSAAWKTGFDWFATTVAEFQALNKSIDEHRKKKDAGLQLTKVMVSSEGFPHMKHHADGRGFPHFYPQTYVLKRGDPNQKDGEATQGFLQVLMPTGRTAADWKTEPPADWTRTSYRRAALANWMTDTETGAGQLAARVIVNRLWHLHFGRGIVATPNDFGFPGERPTHPELLEWLATDLIAHDWKLKRLHKLIMTSSVFMQSGDYDEQRAKIDPVNMSLWRRSPRRLEAEAIRDSMLAIAGQLDTKMFGPGTLDQNMKRRSIYFFIKRSNLIPTMMLFDWPEHLVSIGARSSTTIAPQALMFMNSPQGRQYATAFAGRLPVDSAEEAIQAGYRLALSRSPSQIELKVTSQFISQQEELYRETGQGNARQLALTDFCQTLFSMNEFVYVD
jgi:hypothetical protein